ncbi:MAG: hypothetical protein HY298_19845 [Verrucomicrobia bacterium]|nr:hypothetical protein [Verrucomicrobiota bacterium]
MSTVFGLLACVCSIPLYWGLETTGNLRWLNPASCVSAAFALYYGIGNVPCSLWAYDDMLIKNTGSYAYYPITAVYAAACLFALLLGYKSAISGNLPVGSAQTWNVSQLVAAYWIYATVLLGVTYATAAEILPKLFLSTMKEFTPTGYMVLGVLGFGIRWQAGKGGNANRYFLTYASSIILPVLFFVLCNRRFYVLAMTIFPLLQSRRPGFRWKLRHYVLCVVGVVTVYLTTTVGLRQRLSGGPDDPDDVGYNDLRQNIQLLPGAFHSVLFFDPALHNEFVGSLEQDSAFRMAGLEEPAGIVAARVREEGRFLLGKCAWISAKKMIPKLLWPSKPGIGGGEYDVPDEERTMILEYKLAFEDQLSTPIAAVYADFNWYGALVCMAGMGAVIGCVWRRLQYGEITARSVILGVPFSFSLLIFFERNYVEWLVNPLRNLVIVYLGVRILDLICGEVSRRERLRNGGGGLSVIACKRLSSGGDGLQVSVVSKKATPGTTN